MNRFCKSIFLNRMLDVRFKISLPNLKRLGDPLRIYSSSFLRFSKHVLFFVRARAISDKELPAQVQCLSLHCSGTKPIPYRSQELSEREFSPVGDACRLRVEIIDRTPFAMSDGGALPAPWCERLRIMSLF
jgi:hypothetical protein